MKPEVLVVKCTDLNRNRMIVDTGYALAHQPPHATATALPYGGLSSKLQEALAEAVDSGLNLESVVLCIVPYDNSDGPPLPTENEVRGRFRLTRREAEVALLLARGYSNKQVARALCVTFHTASRHTEKVLSKLGISSRGLVLSVLISMT